MKGDSRLPSWLELFRPATKRDILKIGKEIMSAISEFKDKVESAFTEIGASVDEIVASQAQQTESLNGVTGDVAQLKALIEKLQNSPGGITPEDQATLDQLESTIKALQPKVKAVADAQKTQADALKSLDEATSAEEVPTPDEPE